MLQIVLDGDQCAAVSQMFTSASWRAWLQAKETLITDVDTGQSNKSEPTLQMCIVRRKSVPVWAHAILTAAGDKSTKESGLDLRAEIHKLLLPKHASELHALRTECMFKGATFAAVVHNLHTGLCSLWTSSLLLKYTVTVPPLHVAVCQILFSDNNSTSSSNSDWPVLVSTSDASVRKVLESQTSFDSACIEILCLSQLLSQVKAQPDWRR
jgi:hypothetical protein